MLVNLNNEEVEIDDNIVEEILELNKKGYKTAFCCGGHIEQKNLGIHVTFIRRHDFTIIPNGFTENRYGVIEFLDNKQTNDEIYAKMLRNFKEWVRLLPPLYADEEM